MNRLFKYFSVFGILLVFSAYFFRLFEVNAYVKAIAALTDPSPRLLKMGMIYKIDYFFIAFIMASCLVSFILMNKDNKKIPLFSVSLIPLGLVLVEKLYFMSASNIVAKISEGANISIANIIYIVVASLGLFSIVLSILVMRFLNNKVLAFALSIYAVIAILATTGINIYAACVQGTTVHFIIYTVFFLIALVLFISEFILKYKQKTVDIKIEEEQANS